MQVSQGPGSAVAAVCVSVIIPTRSRPALVVKAVSSVLGQDFESFEVIVVVDGEDAQTQACLRRFCDPRLRVIPLAASVGGAEARNIGIREAHGEWVAFLDDDDEWLPHKLSRQIAAARGRSAARAVISSRLIVRTSEYESVGPLRTYSPEKSLSEFLFCRRSLGDRPIAMQTSTLMVPRELMLAVPFRRGLKRHQDWDWLLRVERVPGVEFEVISEPLVIYRTEDGRDSVGRSQDAEFSMAWSSGMRGFFSAKAYSWFLASECASRAAKSGAGFKVRAEIARRFIWDGAPSAGSAITLGFFLMFPQRWRRSIHRLVRRWRRSGIGLRLPGQNQVQATIGMEL